MKKEQRAVYLVTIEEKVAFYLLTYGFSMERMYIYIYIYIYIKEVLEVLTHLS